MAICAYVRVSTDMQTNENQRFELENWCAKRGWTVDKWVEEAGVSGGKDYKKRKLGDLMAELNEGDTLVACEISRFGRDLMMVMEILRALMDKNVKVYTVKDNFTLTDEIQSKVIAFAFGLAAEIERKLIQQRTKAALDRLKAEGKVLGRPKGSKTRPELSKTLGHATEILDMLRAGASKKAICEALGINRTTLLRYINSSEELKDYRLKSPKKREISREALKDLAEKGYSLPRAARALSVSTSTVLKYANRFGIDFGQAGSESFNSIYEELEARKDEILQRYADGEPLLKIRRELDVSPSIWSVWLKRTGLNEIRTLEDALPQRIAIMTMHSRGLSVRQIAIALRISRPIVERILSGKLSGRTVNSIKELTTAEREMARQNGVTDDALCRRIRRGWEVNDAIHTPMMARGRRVSQ